LIPIDIGACNCRDGSVNNVIMFFEGNIRRKTYRNESAECRDLIVGKLTPIIGTRLENGIAYRSRIAIG